MKILLRLRNWKLFLLLVGVPVAVMVLGIVAMFFYQRPGWLQFGLPAALVYYVLLYAGWFYAAGKRLWQRLPDSINVGFGLFKVLLLMPVVYLLVLALLMFGVGLFGFGAGISNLLHWLLSVPAQGLCLLCLLYGQYFVARAVKTVALGRKVAFKEYAGLLLLFILFPIGILFAQPRIQRVVTN